MINIAIPMEDELVRGLIGRIAHLNGLHSMRETISALRKAHPEIGEEPALSLTARFCGMDAIPFATQHSMLRHMFPIRINTEGRKRHWILSRGLDTPYRDLRYCPTCSREDRTERGFSHWRRKHQICGIDWCTAHGTPLITVENEDGFHSPGSRGRHQSPAITDDALRIETNNPALKRLLTIQLAWLELQEPIGLSAWHEVISRQCIAMGLRRSEVGKRPIASDRIQACFPESWLRRYLPEVADKTTGTALRKIDGASFDRHIAYPSLACATILAALFPNAEQALAKLKQTDQPPSLQKSMQESVELAYNAFLQGYGLQEATKLYGADIHCLETYLRKHLVQLNDRQAA